MRKINSLLYKAYLKKAGLLTGTQEIYYTLTEPLHSGFFTLHILRMIKEV